LAEKKVKGLARLVGVDGANLAGSRGGKLQRGATADEDGHYSFAAAL